MIRHRVLKNKCNLNFAEVINILSSIGIFTDASDYCSSSEHFFALNQTNFF